MRTYAIVSAMVMLAIGILGFAFNESFNIPSYALIIDLVLGVWGMVAVFSKAKK